MNLKVDASNTLNINEVNIPEQKDVEKFVMKRALCPTEMLQQHMTSINQHEDSYNLQAAVLKGIKASGHGNYLGGTRSQTAMNHQPQASITSSIRPKSSFHVDNQSQCSTAMVLGQIMNHGSFGGGIMKSEGKDHEVNVDLVQTANSQLQNLAMYGSTVQNGYNQDTSSVGEFMHTQNNAAMSQQFGT